MLTRPCRPDSPTTTVRRDLGTRAPDPQLTRPSRSPPPQPLPQGLAVAREDLVRPAGQEALAPRRPRRKGHQGWTQVRTLLGVARARADAGEVVVAGRIGSTGLADWTGQQNRRAARREMLTVCVSVDRPTELLRPAVRCPTSRYNTKLRAGKGFTKVELKAAGIRAKEALSIGIPVDHRRRNKSEEGLKLNTARLEAYKARLVVFPKKAGKVKKGDTEVRTPPHPLSSGQLCSFFSPRSPARLSVAHLPRSRYPCRPTRLVFAPPGCFRRRPYRPLRPCRLPHPRRHGRRGPPRHHRC